MTPVADRLKDVDIVPTIDAVNAYRLGMSDAAPQIIDPVDEGTRAAQRVAQLEMAVTDIGRIVRRALNA